VTEEEQMATEEVTTNCAGQKALVTANVISLRAAKVKAVLITVLKVQPELLRKQAQDSRKAVSIRWMRMMNCRSDSLKLGEVCKIKWKGGVFQCQVEKETIKAATGTLMTRVKAKAA
jgi:hypothetical protein